MVHLRKNPYRRARVQLKSLKPFFSSGAIVCQVGPGFNFGHSDILVVGLSPFTLTFHNNFFISLILAHFRHSLATKVLIMAVLSIRGTPFYAADVRFYLIKKGVQGLRIMG